MRISHRAAASPPPCTSATLLGDDICRLTRTVTGLHAVTLRAAGQARPTGSTQIVMGEGEGLTQAALAASAAALRSGWTATLLCRDLAQATALYADILAVQDGRINVPALPMGGVP